ncbi:hypothetical protein [Pararhizobium qamdonense]|uniref:hypothetical protein n=1 Tax=Pararhizobium qamdonense TaxID=3031126 RepID=UPI0023E186BF|nr:hypothetical protein [Pararhizobium qamdonense]
MTPYEDGSDMQMIPSNDLEMMAQTLTVWCNQHDIDRSNAYPQAKILMDTYRKGKRSQIELLDALVQSQH